MEKKPELTFLEVLESHGFSITTHMASRWIQLYSRGRMQYCEVDGRRARLVAAGIGEIWFTDPKKLDDVLTKAK
jgi:hypothetical protein